ncbi:MAG: trypsin-like peptidase domain-containing protein [Geothrix sp.]|uniref:S1 family peptidase n=1 Tax=Geothrix sp. TaxID=1962974 RepID=UPI001797E4D9|nr:trypsin-like peptidase domain-containing protein [Geothrix sp.]NWJ42423.1 trypsin-like peptidase domain-containing protein [Geothrix sp.]WIL19612.1 MAG: trypsin-like peptidase domain-containing protein [Geothrix sp.]
MRFLTRLVLPCLLLGTLLAAQESALAPAVKNRVTDASFEVVVPRADPAKDPVSYEKDLPWDLVPFNLRNDPYVSIGTAFAISKTTLVTAHHVFQSLHASRGYQTCFIRDAKQNVWEVDQILALDEQRDVIEFSVKGRTFEQWLELRPGFKDNETVFTVGNAYGEGLVIRPGELIGTIPEPLRGAWNLLKSSAGVNPGNSGGPLVDPQGRVVGVVLGKKDNICYSLPTEELKAVKPDLARFFNKVTFSFSLFPEKSSALERAYDVPLPRAYAELRKEIAIKEKAFYFKSMDGLFTSLGQELFPSSEASEEAVADIPTSGNPEVIFRDNTTKKWSFSGLEYKSNDLPKNGRISYAQANGVYLFKIRRPDGLPLGDLLTKPKVSMDLLLKGASVSRTVGGQAIRVTSFGEPYQVQPHADRFGRLWQQAIWFTAYDDGVVLTYSTLVPSGVVMAVRFINSSSLMEWLYDLPKFLDYTYVPYAGRLKDWSEFLQHRERLPAALRGMTFDFQEGKHLRFQALWAKADLGPAQMELSAKAFLILNMGFSRKGPEVLWDLRRVNIAEDEEDNYFVLLRHIHPTPAMPESDQKRWKEIARQRHPYTRRTYEEEGASRIATVHPAFLKADTPADENTDLFTVYLARVGKVEDKEMQTRIQGLLQALTRSGASPSSQVVQVQPSTPAAATR